MNEGTQFSANVTAPVTVGAQTLALAALLSSAVGTGGIASGPVVATICRPATGIIAPSSTVRGAVTISNEGIGERLTLVQSYFNLSISDLARVLRVKRPTIYAWLRGAPSSLREANHNRLETLYRLAAELHRTLGTTVVDPNSVRLPSGNTLLEILQAETLDIAWVSSALDGASQSVARTESLVSRLRRENNFAKTPQDLQKLNLEDMLGP